MEIKRLSIDDPDLFIELINLFEAGKNGLSSTGDDLEALQTLLSNRDFYSIVAIIDNKVIGGLTAYALQMYKKRVVEVFLYEIELAPSYQRKGIGTKLVEYLVQESQQAYLHMEMIVLADESNNAARGFYEKTGAQKEGTQVLYHYYPGE